MIVSHDQTKHEVHLCYCMIPEDALIAIARQRYVEKIPTETLMEQYPSRAAKEYVAAIALLDVKAEDLPKVVPVSDPELLRHLLDCRGHVKDYLAQNGIAITDR